MEKTKLALAKFYESVGEHYPEEEQVYKTLRGILRKKFVLSYLQQFNGKLLEVGCNQGMYLQAYQNGASFGIDLSLNVLKKAHSGKKLYLAVADAERLECFKNNSFDHVLCSEVLEHCLNPELIFKGIYHVLKPGGTVLLTTPYFTGEKPKWIGLGTLKHYNVEYENGDEYFHTAYNPQELEAFANNAGLTVLKSGTFEKEIKYAAKLPAAILLFGRMINRLFKSKKFDIYNERFFNKLTIWIYNFCYYAGFEKLLMLLIPNGVRSFIYMKKGEN